MNIMNNDNVNNLTLNDNNNPQEDNQNQNISFENIGTPLLGLQVVKGIDHDGSYLDCLQINKNFVVIPRAYNEVELFDLQNRRAVQISQDGIDEKYIPQELKQALNGTDGKYDKWDSMKFIEIINAIKKIQKTDVHLEMSADSPFSKRVEEIKQKLMEYITTHPEEQNMNNQNMNINNSGNLSFTLQDQNGKNNGFGKNVGGYGGQ